VRVLGTTVPVRIMKPVVTRDVQIALGAEALDYLKDLYKQHTISSTILMVFDQWTRASAIMGFATTDTLQKAYRRHASSQGLTFEHFVAALCTCEGSVKSSIRSWANTDVACMLRDRCLRNGSLSKNVGELTGTVGGPLGPKVGSTSNTPSSSAPSSSAGPPPTSSNSGNRKKMHASAQKLRAEFRKGGKDRQNQINLALQEFEHQVKDFAAESATRQAKRHGPRKIQTSPFVQAVLKTTQAPLKRIWAEFTGASKSKRGTVTCTGWIKICGFLGISEDVAQGIFDEGCVNNMDYEGFLSALCLYCKRLGPADIGEGIDIAVARRMKKLLLEDNDILSIQLPYRIRACAHADTVQEMLMAASNAVVDPDKCLQDLINSIKILDRQPQLVILAEALTRCLQKGQDPTAAYDALVACPPIIRFDPASRRPSSASRGSTSTPVHNLPPRRKNSAASSSSRLSAGASPAIAQAHSCGVDSTQSSGAGTPTSSSTPIHSSKTTAVTKSGAKQRHPLKGDALLALRSKARPGLPPRTPYKAHHTHTGINNPPSSKISSLPPQSPQLSTALEAASKALVKEGPTKTKDNGSVSTTATTTTTRGGKDENENDNAGSLSSSGGRLHGITRPAPAPLMAIPSSPVPSPSAFRQQASSSAASPSIAALSPSADSSALGTVTALSPSGVHASSYAASPRWTPVGASSAKEHEFVHSLQELKQSVGELRLLMGKKDEEGAAQRLLNTISEKTSQLLTLDAEASPRHVHPIPATTRSTHGNGTPQSSWPPNYYIGDTHTSPIISSIADDALLDEESGKQNRRHERIGHEEKEYNGGDEVDPIEPAETASPEGVLVPSQSSRWSRKGGFTDTKHEDGEEGKGRPTSPVVSLSLMQKDSDHQGQAETLMGMLRKDKCSEPTSSSSVQQKTLTRSTTDPRKEEEKSRPSREYLLLKTAATYGPVSYSLHNIRKGLARTSKAEAPLSSSIGFKPEPSSYQGKPERRSPLVLQKKASPITTQSLTSSPSSNAQRREEQFIHDEGITPTDTEKLLCSLDSSNRVHEVNAGLTSLGGSEYMATKNRPPRQSTKSLQSPSMSSFLSRRNGGGGSEASPTSPQKEGGQNGSRGTTSPSATASSSQRNGGSSKSPRQQQSQSQSRILPKKINSGARLPPAVSQTSPLSSGRLLGHTNRIRGVTVTQSVSGGIIQAAPNPKQRHNNERRKVASSMTSIQTVGEFLSPDVKPAGVDGSSLSPRSKEDLKHTEVSGEEMYAASSDDGFPRSISTDGHSPSHPTSPLSAQLENQQPQHKLSGGLPTSTTTNNKPTSHIGAVRWEVDTVTKGWAPLNVEVQVALDQAWKRMEIGTTTITSKDKTFEVDWDGMMMGRVGGVAPRALRRVANQDTRMSMEEDEKDDDTPFDVSPLSPSSDNAPGVARGSDNNGLSAFSREIEREMAQRLERNSEERGKKELLRDSGYIGHAPNPRGAPDTLLDESDELNFTMESVKLTPLLTKSVSRRYQQT